METKRFTAFRDLITEKYIVAVTQPNKRLKQLKQYPYAYKIGRSFLGELKNDTLENLKKDGTEVILV